MNENKKYVIFLLFYYYYYYYYYIEHQKSLYIGLACIRNGSFTLNILIMEGVHLYNGRDQPRTKRSADKFVQHMNDLK